MDLEDIQSAKNFSIGTRSISHPYYPLKQTSKMSASFQENHKLSFPPTTPQVPADDQWAHSWAMSALETTLLPKRLQQCITHNP
jgi:hypothetical protein